MKLQQEYRETTIINKSRFIACVSRCDTEEEARFYIDGIRREFPDTSDQVTEHIIRPQTPKSGKCSRLLFPGSIPDDRKRHK